MMDLSTHANTAGGVSASELFAKRDVVTPHLSRSQRKKAKSALGGHDNNDSAAGKITNNTAALMDQTTAVIPPAEAQRRKKHLSHKKDPMDLDELRRTVFVGNLPNTVSKQQVQQHFEREVGNVESARVRCVQLARLEQGQKNRGRGVRILRGEIDRSESATATAYVVFNDEDAAANAMSKSGMLFRDRHLSITSETPGAKAYEPRSSVYLGNLPYDVTDEMVWQFFTHPEGAGLADVTRVRIVRDPMTGKSKGFGYVEFGSRASVVQALKIKDAQIGGRSIRIFSVHKSRDPVVTNKVTRRDKRAVAAASAAPNSNKSKKQQQEQQQNTTAAAATSSDEKPSQRTSKKQQQQQQQKSKTTKVPTIPVEERPSWMGTTVDPRKKLSKELRWLTAAPHDRKAAAKARQKDRVKAAFAKKRKDARASGGE